MKHILIALKRTSVVNKLFIIIFLVGAMCLGYISLMCIFPNFFGLRAVPSVVSVFWFVFSFGLFCIVCSTLHEIYAEKLLPEICEHFENECREKGDIDKFMSALDPYLGDLFFEHTVRRAGLRGLILAREFGLSQNSH